MYAVYMYIRLPHPRCVKDNGGGGRAWAHSILGMGISGATNKKGGEGEGLWVHLSKSIDNAKPGSFFTYPRLFTLILDILSL